MDHRLLSFVFGFVLAALLAELVLRALPVSTGYHLGAIDANHPIAHGAPHFRYTYSKDWSFHLENSGVLNNYGFRSAHDYVPDSHALAIIGNSYIQADAVEPPDSIGERIAAQLRRPVYAVAMDGFSLVDYLEAARWASATFGARTLLILLTTGDLRHSCMPQTGAHYLRSTNGAMRMTLVDRQSPSQIKRWLNESMLFRYLYDNLHAAANLSKGWRREDDGPPKLDALAAGLGCVDAQFETAATQFLLQSFHDIEIDRHARVIFLLAPGYRREQLVAAGGIRDVDRFAERAALEGFEVVHMDAAFAAALHSGIRLDFLPIDGHWNAAAHAIAARVAADALQRSLVAARIDEAKPADRSRTGLDRRP